jgi:predicted transcriptional regulator
VIPHKLSEAADAAASRYDLLASTFEAQFKTALLSPQFGYAGQQLAIYNDAYEAAGEYFTRDKEEMAGAVLEIAENAHQRAKQKIASIDASGLSDAALEHLGESQTYLSNEIAAQVHRDIANMRHSLQKTVLDVGMIARSRRIPQRQAQIAWVMNRAEDLELAFVDRRGRRTPTRTFIRSVYRQTLLSVHNEIVLHTIADHGLEHAAVMKLEDGVEKQVERIALTDYADARAVYFHPNANTYLDVETDDV